MANENKDVKSVAFSKFIPAEQKFLRYAMKQGAFSTYVKRLIQRDMEQGHKVVSNPEATERIKQLEAENKELKDKLNQIKALIDN